MLRYLYLLLVLLLSICSAYSATVEVDVRLNPSETRFDYSFYFNSTDSHNTFSFEKPQDAIIVRAADSQGENIRYSIAGDYFIIRPNESTSDMQIFISFISEDISEKALSTYSYSNYVNFNFPVESLNYMITISEGFPEISQIYPRDYELTDSGAIIWNIEEIREDTLFLINFVSPGSRSWFLNPPQVYYISTGLLLLVMALVFFLFRFRNNRRQKVPVILNAPIQQPPSSKEVPTDSAEAPDRQEKESFEEIVEKYLTENEKEVVEVVRENDGISQYDILNFLPHMSKSNLSKIISKLHARKFLSRIKVGKVNKIYLGEKLENKK